MPSPNHPRLLALGAADAAAIRSRIAELGSIVGEEPGLATLDRLAARLSAELPAPAAVRCAIVASTAAELADGLADAERALERGGLAIEGRAYAGSGGPLRIGLLFPGQGAPVRTGAGGLGDRIPAAAEAFAAAGLPAQPGEVPDELVQLSVVTASLAALAALRALGVEAEVAAGHSLGELTALHWAGAVDAAGLRRLALARGAAMTSEAAGGTMASVEAGERDLGELAQGLGVTVACLNSPRQCVVSGEVGGVEALVARARERRVRARRLPVVGAFHSPLMQPAVPAFERTLAGEAFAPPRRRVISSVSGRALAPGADLRAHLARQIVSPVRFAEAAAATAREAGLLVEAGPGRILAGLAAEIASLPALSMRVGERSSAGAVEVAAAAFAAGAPVAVERLATAPAEAVGG